MEMIESTLFYAFAKMFLYKDWLILGIELKFYNNSINELRQIAIGVEIWLKCYFIHFTSKSPYDRTVRTAPILVSCHFASK